MNYFCVLQRRIYDILWYKNLGAYPKSPSYHKIPLWERLSAAKLNDRGWKRLPHDQYNLQSSIPARSG